MGKINSYMQLMRFDKPIGTLLLLWPTLWGLWIAARGLPERKILLIFVAGVILMRAAGCVINDFADRHIDGQVKRTKNRPLATKSVSVFAAWVLFILLSLTSFGLVLFTNRFTISLSFVAIFFAILYPFSKRFTHLPQFILGLAFSWSIPMSFAAQTNHIPFVAWILFIAGVLWTVVYDTQYAMVDRADDLRIGIKSTAILFGRFDMLIIGSLQWLVIMLLGLIGFYLHLNFWFYLGLLGAIGLALYQQRLICRRDTSACFNAFLNNNWFGFAIFCGIFLSYWK